MSDGNDGSPDSVDSVVAGPWAVVDPRRCELGEGARWLSPGRFVLVDLLAGRLFSTDGTPGSGLRDEARLDAPLGAVAPRAGGWIAAAGTGVALLDDEPDAPVRWLANPAEDGSVPLRMNDGVADPAGRFWAGAMPYGGEPGTGFLVRTDPDGSTRVVLDGLTIPNGPAFSADGARMYLADTPTGDIRAYDVDPETGDLRGGHVLAHVDEGGPDGMTVDAEGCLWSAVWGAGQLHRYAPTGELLERVTVPVRQPTSIAISGDAPFRIVVTSAAHGLDDHPDWPHDGRVLTAEVRVGGTPAARWG